MSTNDALVPRSQDYNEWYNTVVLRADMADYGPVRGTMIVKPYGWALWENMQQALDRRFKATGHLNAAFPMFIPMSFMEREAKHVEGFSPELAVVTHAGGEELAEPFVVRPTSETIIGDAYSRWIKSYRDLPILINLWNSVVRWELRTKLFLRTSEFFWQEGHTAHATLAEAEFEARQMLDVYTDFAVNEAALPVIPGEKSAAERFAGADRTYTIEAMMGDGRALQSGTSHNLGQNFAKAFNIRYLDQSNNLQYCWTTSFGFSTRVIGAIIMVHGDDKGLVLPPRLAPFQVVIVPIYRDDEQKSAVLEAATRLHHQLAAANLRVKLDLRDHLSPGYKFNDWELRGVPLRLEIGPKDIANNSVALARRDRPGREGKQFVSQDGLTATITTLLDDIQQSLLTRATEFREAHTHEAQDYAEFQTAVQTGFARVWWAGNNDDERRIKEETKATIRCFPIAQPGGIGRCFYTNRPAHQIAIFGRSY
jgi:prolyl-tRNA synthetase